MIGGVGNDTYVVDNALDVVTELAGAGTDTVQTTLASYTLGANVENLTFIGSGSFSGTGNALNNTIRGGIGADTMAGLAGSDTYIVDNALDVVIEAAGAGTDTVQTTLLSYTLGANVENLTYTSTGNFSGTGNALNNAIQGGSGADTLLGAAGIDFLSGGAGNDSINGGIGNDILVGGTGNDVFVVTAVGFGNDTIQDFDADPAGGQDRVDITGFGITAATFAGLVSITDVGADTLIGIGADSIRLVGVANATTIDASDFILSTGISTIVGTAGDDLLIGDAGANTMIGLAGNDTYVVDNVLDVVTEIAGAGIDTVRTTLASYTLGANVENLTFIGSGSFSGTGNVLDNVISGGAGADTMAGLTGNDTYVVDNALDVVTELAGAGTDTVQTTLASYTLGANVENLTFIGSGSFSGTGNVLDNVIRGGAGADTMAGLTGNDTYVVDNVLDVVTELAAAGIDTVQTTLASYTLGANVENLTFIGSGSFSGTGNALNNTIRGGSGADTMTGGTGNDTYFVDNALDLVNELVGAGIDTVQTTLASYTLGANVENLTFTGVGNFSGTGNALNNTIRGGSGADTLNGGTGNDSLTGGLGNDVFRFITSGFGNDLVQDFDADPAGGQDRLDISGLGITAATFTGAVSITDVGADTLIGIGANSIRLVGIADATTIDATDFILA